MRLFDFLFPPRVDEVTLRGVTDEDFFSLMSPRLVPETRPSTVALLPFHDPRVRAALHEAKYHGSERAFRLLGAVLAEYLHGHDDLERRTAIIIPIPLGKKRLKERRFNQVEEVARRALRELGKESRITVDTSLIARVRETPSQVSLEREKREVNMRGAFACLPVGRAQIDSTYTYIVLDDVVTTGATLQATIDALTAAGATQIMPIALAH